MARIMIIDDMKWVAEIMAKKLQELGHDVAVVSEFHNVPLETVVKQVLEFKPELLALDHYLFGSYASPYSGANVYEEVEKRTVPCPKILGLGSSSGTQPYALMHSNFSKHDIKKEWSMRNFIESIDILLVR